ncbi:unnamed protein product [Strongylus vulgaris]|uniref:Uncharacterized protein n=1 Tax=Strongylus vulgaris TaxID=40348 RepID=A0A3P7HZG2_STRVU|nr:unnamed protein product [Strongylus vulgaris]
MKIEAWDDLAVRLKSHYYMNAQNSGSGHQKLQRRSSLDFAENLKDQG